MDLKNIQADPSAFRQALMIDTDQGPRPLGEVADPWQRTDFEALDAGWKRAVVGAKSKATFSRGWLERPRGHSKSADLGIMAAWALFASRRRLSGIGAAGDQDQARLLRDAIGKLLLINPWLASVLEVQSYRVLNTRTQSSLEIISSDAPTAYGLTPDFLICDEVVHWRKRDLWDSLISSAAKRSTCMVCVITNAGIQDDWTWKAREIIRKDAGWYFSRLEGPVASWITPEALAEQERLLPSIAYRRLWLNEWTQGGGDALTTETISQAFHDYLRPQTSAQAGFEYCAGLDLGVSRDASAVCVLGVHRGRTDHGRIRLASTKIWRATKGHKINLQLIEDYLVDLNSRFDLKSLNFDPWQASFMAQRLGATGLAVPQKNMQKYWMTERIRMVEIAQTGQNLQKMATATIEAFNDARVELYENADLRRDLNRLRVEERSYGFRLVSPRDELGHGDLGSAFTLAMLAASELASKKKIYIGDPRCRPDEDGVEKTRYEVMHQVYEAQRAAEMELHQRFATADPFDQEPLINAMRDMFRPTDRF